ncbi:MAG: amidohydrolase [Clostridiales bacterium GWB2_37_7]|nr:MAG: amidohydrolase [Clostridiales bacterium GWB2_37_7]
MNTIEAIQNNLDKVKLLRNKLSQNAELSYQEYKTQQIIVDFFDSIHVPASKLFSTGVVAAMNNEEPCIALRADMDALPVNGVSHACGHDYHMVIVCGVALVLKELGYKKCLKFIFQPGEESDGGAAPMIQEGVLDNPKVSNMIGFHVWPNVLVGTVEAAAGPSMASVDDFQIIIKGKGGHAAMPYLCKNPLYPAMDFIQTINEKSKLEITPLDSHVITFSSLQCGNAPNVISDECIVLGTVRTFNNDVRNKIHADMLKTSAICAEKYGCTIDVKYNFQYPPLLNDASFTDRFISITKELIGEKNVLPLQRTFAAEDFAYFAEKVPSVHFRLGIADEQKGQHPLHSTSFDAHEDAIFHGIHIITNFILSITDDK